MTDRGQRIDIKGKMLRKTIGIHLDTKQAAIVQISQHGKNCRIEKEVSGPIDADLLLSSGRSIELGQIAKMIETSGMAEKARVVVSIPGAWTHYCSLKTDLTHLDDLKRHLPYELEDDVPIEFDDLIIDIVDQEQEGQKARYLVAASRRSQVQMLKTALSASEIDCQVLSVDVDAIASLVRYFNVVPTDQTVMVVALVQSRTIIGVFDNGYLCIGRSVPCWVRSEDCIDEILGELDGTLRYCNTVLGKIPSECILWEGDEKDSDLQKSIGDHLQTPVSLLDLTNKLNREQCRLGSGHLVALGLALRGCCAKDTLPNFISADLREASFTKDIRRSLKIGGVLLVLLIFAVCGFGTIRFSQFKHRNEMLDQKIESVFKESLPNISKIVQPVPQMTEQLQLLQKEFNLFSQAVNQGAMPLHVLQKISQITGKRNDVIINSLMIESDTIDIEGLGDSYESNETLVSNLRLIPDFAEVAMESDSIKKVNNKVRFTIHIVRASSRD